MYCVHNWFIISYVGQREVIEIFSFVFFVVDFFKVHTFGCKIKFSFCCGPFEMCTVCWFVGLKKEYSDDFGVVFFMKLPNDFIFVVLDLACV